MTSSYYIHGLYNVIFYLREVTKCVDKIKNLLSYLSYKEMNLFSQIEGIDMKIHNYMEDG